MKETEKEKKERRREEGDEDGQSRSRPKQRVGPSSPPLQLLGAHMRRQRRDVGGSLAPSSSPSSSAMSALSRAILRGSAPLPHGCPPGSAQAAAASSSSSSSSLLHPTTGLLARNVQRQQEDELMSLFEHVYLDAQAGAAAAAAARRADPAADGVDPRAASSGSVGVAAEDGASQGALPPLPVSLARAAQQAASSSGALNATQQLRSALASATVLGSMAGGVDPAVAAEQQLAVSRAAAGAAAAAGGGASATEAMERTAAMTREFFMPAKCCTAPLMPSAR